MKKNTSKFDVIGAENKKLRAEVDQLNVRLNSLEQMSRINNLEVVGVPDRENEYLIHIFQKITEALEKREG